MLESFRAENAKPWAFGFQLEVPYNIWHIMIGLLRSLDRNVFQFLSLDFCQPNPLDNWIVNYDESEQIGRIDQA